MALNHGIVINNRDNGISSWYSTKQLASMARAAVKAQGKFKFVDYFVSITRENATLVATYEHPEVNGKCWRSQVNIAI